LAETVAGRLLVFLFYGVAPDAAQIVGRSPELKADITCIVANNRELLAALAQGKPGLIKAR
jgi:hypothetical protein